MQSDLRDPETRYEELVRQYAGLVARAVARVAAGSAVDRDEIEQRVLLALWKQVEREQEIDRPASYLYKAAARETVRAIRREVERRRNEVDAPAELESAAAAGDPHRDLVERERALALRGCIGELAPDRRQAVAAHLAGFGVQEIMRGYGWSYQRARNLVARGLTDLRAALRRRGIDGT